MKVAIVRDDRLDYGREAPFHPPERYPEYPFDRVGGANPAYGKVREVLRTLGLDADRYGRRTWNPLGEMISPGDSVVIKPNFVGHYNPVGSLEAMITQGSIIRAVLDFVAIAQAGSGRVTIADAPSIDSDFDRIVAATGVDRIAAFYRESAGLSVPVVDMRKEKGQMKLGKLIHEQLAGDPLGYTVVDLKGDSAHAGIDEDYRRYRSLNYSREVMFKHHNKDRHEYCIGNSVLHADVVVNLPKLKTHNKTGITCALKNLIGINGYKDWLPHHRAGSAEEGGDEYERRDLRKRISVALRDEIAVHDRLLEAMPLRTASNLLYFSRLALPFRDEFHAGCWHGNDTLPRTIADLNRIVRYADKGGALRETPQRKMFALVDGIVAGEKEGPQTPEARKCGTLIAGDNPVAVDLVCSRVMGFDYRKMATFRYAMGGGRHGLFSGSPEELGIVAELCNDFGGIYGAYGMAFVPAAGWRGHIEYEGREARVQKKEDPIPAKARSPMV